MSQHVAKVSDVEVRILLHARPDDNAAETDEEIDRRLRFQVADAVSDECSLAVRARADVADEQLLAAGPCKKRPAIEVFIVAVRVERELHGMDVFHMQRIRERNDRLLDAGGEEMDD